MFNKKEQEKTIENFVQYARLSSLYEDDQAIEDKINEFLENIYTKEILEDINLSEYGTIEIINKGHNEIDQIFFTDKNILFQNSLNIFNFDEDEELENANFTLSTRESFDKGFMPDPSIFKYNDFKKEKENKDFVMDTIKKIYGGIRHAGILKIYHQVNNKTTSYYQCRFYINAFGNEDYLDVYFSTINNLWDCDIFKKSIQLSILKIADIDYDISEISSDNLEEIGRSVQAVIY